MSPSQGEGRLADPRGSSGLALPGNDCWIFDGVTVLFNHSTGDGAWAGNELTTDPQVAQLCAGAFEAVWELGIPHGEYKIK
ncbi:hypothetical protein KGA66_03085 [Actinocrinis puniceicyclus]|uniref:DUF6879 domain-containing protein n=1 Tax=Actinocrinis puniceicyclus TaxID=977794 RepID=A0A8J8B9N2_9ACTN|nr:DUF6879 family protein [Actinocrinis puniceicyclus]MBS2962017.1 hypothetical protein [Actinocrinis puniceicyclus]